jgi:hypothetical protein
MEVEAAVALMHDLCGHNRFDDLMEKWADALSGAQGLYRLVIEICVELERTADWPSRIEHIPNHGWYDVSDALACLLIDRALADEAPPDSEAEIAALVAKALTPPTPADIMPPPVPAKTDACMGCWSVPIECTEGCGAMICTCNISNHDCDTFKAGGE